jgi:hypothetical protein
MFSSKIRLAPLPLAAHRYRMRLLSDMIIVTGTLYNNESVTALYRMLNCRFYDRSRALEATHNWSAS